MGKRKTCLNAVVEYCKDILEQETETFACVSELIYVSTEHQLDKKEIEKVVKKIGFPPEVDQEKLKELLHMKSVYNKEVEQKLKNGVQINDQTVNRKQLKIKSRINEIKMELMNSNKVVSKNDRSNTEQHIR